MNKETLRMQMLAGIITESQYKQKLKKFDSKLKFHQVERDRKYFATTNFGIFKKGDEVFVDTVRNLGTEVVLELSNSKGKHDSIKGDLEDEVEVFDNNHPLNEEEGNKENIHPFFDFDKHKVYVELDDIDSILVYDFDILSEPIFSQDPEVDYGGEIELTFNEGESTLNGDVSDYIGYIKDLITTHPDKYEFWHEWSRSNQ